MKVSVIMPVYNASKYLHQCLDSIVCQTLQDIEIICVDDGSSDNSLEILEEYARKDSRVKIVRQENGGAAAARNNGLTYAKGEYLSILDCDDFFEPDMLEKSYLRAKETDSDIVIFRCDLYDDSKETFYASDYTLRRDLLPEKDVFSALDVEKDIFCLCKGWAWDKLFRRSFVEENHMQFQVQRSTNDLLFVFTGLLRAERIATMDNVFAHYRQSEGTLSVTREKSWMCFYNALMALREELYRSGLYERFEQDFKNYCIHLTLWHLYTLKEPTHTLLYNKLRNEWFAEMGILEHPAEYFYSKYEYRCFRNIYEHSIDYWKKRGLTYQTAADAYFAKEAQKRAKAKAKAKAKAASVKKVRASIPGRLIICLQRCGFKGTVRKIVKKLRSLIGGK